MRLLLRACRPQPGSPTAVRAAPGAATARVLVAASTTLGRLLLIPLPSSPLTTPPPATTTFSPNAEETKKPQRNAHNGQKRPVRSCRPAKPNRPGRVNRLPRPSPDDHRPGDLQVPHSRVAGWPCEIGTLTSRDPARVPAPGRPPVAPAPAEAAIAADPTRVLAENLDSRRIISPTSMPYSESGRSGKCRRSLEPLTLPSPQGRGKGEGALLTGDLFGVCSRGGPEPRRGERVGHDRSLGDLCTGRQGIRACAGSGSGSLTSSLGDRPALGLGGS